jgi:Putative adhesin
MTKGTAMPNFETPEPISVTLELGVGNVCITASDRADTAVDVRPSDPSDESDVQAAQRVRVDYANGVLQVIGPKARMFDFSRKTRSVEVSVELPSGSQVSGNVQLGDLRGTGRLGECRFKSAIGNVRLERTGPLRLDLAAGHVTADGVAGTAEIHTGSGKVHLGEVEGSVVVKNSNGDTTITAVTGDVRVKAANGDISVDRAGANVDAKTSNGSVRLGEVARGSVALGTAMGDLEIGIAKGTAAWLEVNTGFGKVHNLLANAIRPEESDETVQVRGRTSYGDITIHRS